MSTVTFESLSSLGPRSAWYYLGRTEGVDREREPRIPAEHAEGPLQISCIMDFPAGPHILAPCGCIRDTMMQSIEKLYGHNGNNGLQWSE